jgi:ubiquinone biosynthesis protein
VLDASTIAATRGAVEPQQLRAKLQSFLPQGATTAEKIRAIESGLQSPLGLSLRDAMARWIVDEIVPANRLVPDAYANWRPPVREAMMFVVARLSPGRLAPKLLEQLELPFDTLAEVRLLRLIAKVPGLQKLGQVIARNQHLHPALRKALTKLENGIHDVDAAQVCDIVLKELGSKAKTYQVKISSQILKEASVSAVVRFRWRNPYTGQPQRGVFKVLKPHIPAFFAEDMDYLQKLAQYFGDRHHTYGFPPHLIPDTFRKVRRLLRHEVNFRREQKTLVEAAALYRSYRGIRIPQVIQPLCTSTVTALSEELGIKITNAAAYLTGSARRNVAEHLVEALIAVPLLSSVENAVFHGDPHAGNLLYHSRSKELVILDWALRERLGREQRRHLALLFLMVALRDPVGVTNEVFALSQTRVHAGSQKNRLVYDSVVSFLDAMPASHLPSAADSMRLLEQIAMKGIRFPASLIMLSKVMFTLEGILAEIAGADTAMGFAVARQIAMHWLAHRSEFRLPLEGRDWLTLQCSMLLFLSRLGIRWQETILDRWLTPSRTTAAAI